MALIDNQIRSATVTCVEDTECMLGTAENFSALIDKLDPALKVAMKQVVATIREKNNYAKEKMSPTEIAGFAVLKRKIDQIKLSILGNPPLMKKINSLDPFLINVFQSLIRLL
jgi:CRP-like cAMP-binding protein